MKNCKRCETTKPYSEFNKDKSSNDGCKFYCKECRKLESKKYREENSEKIAEYRTTDSYKESIERHQQSDKCQSRLKKYRVSDRYKEIQRNYRLKNPEYLNLKCRKRYAKKRNLLHPDHDSKVELQMYRECKKLEIETGYKWSVDHIYPLDLGGPHWHLNMQVIPASTNSRKGNNLDFIEDGIKHWKELPKEVLDWIDSN